MDKQIHLKIAEEDNNDLKVLAKAIGLTKTDTIRMAIIYLLHKNRELIKAEKKLEKENSMIEEKKIRLLKEIEEIKGEK